MVIKKWMTVLIMHICNIQNAYTYAHFTMLIHKIHIYHVITSA